MRGAIIRWKCPVFLPGCSALLVFLCQFTGLWAQPPGLSQPSAASDVRLFNASRINTDGLEFCPSIYENGLVYVSHYRNGPVNPRTGETYLELFYAELDPNGMPGKPTSFSTEINSAYHEGPVSFNQSGDRIFFTRNNQQDGVRRSDNKGRVVLKIYEAQRGVFDWENVQELPFNSDAYTCMHPALSADERKLFFASDQPGGYGGMDLYVSEFRNGFWSPAINLGPEINTNRNEAFPFVHESGLLFFASEGHKGLGGYDIFMVDMSTRQWGAVTNLGEPLNSPSDDLGLVLLADGHRGYFTSARPGGFGQDDIYMFYSPLGINSINGPQEMPITVVVTDRSTSRRLPGASIRLYEVNKDGLINDDSVYDMEIVTNDAGETLMKPILKKEEQLGTPTAVSDREGVSYLEVFPAQDYVIMVAKQGYFTQEKRFRTADDGTAPVQEFLLDPSNCITLTGIVRSDRFQIPIPNVELVLTNLCDNSTSRYRSNLKGEYEICLPLGCDFELKGMKEGYEAGQTNVTTVRLRGSRSLEADLFIHPTSDAILREPIREGTVIVLENIYYDFNKSAIRTGSARDLEALARLMAHYPSMQVELGAHTDSRGSDDYNLDLSKRRAESAKDFLIQRGIAADRIRTVGYGESRPRNHCDDGVQCTEEEFGVNRRTEVRVLNIDESLSTDESGGQ